MPLRRVRTSVKQLQPFERGHNVGLWEAGWTYRRIAAHVGHNVSVVCRCFQQWSVEHSHTSRPGSGRQRSADACQDPRIIGALVVARTASREDRPLASLMVQVGQPIIQEGRQNFIILHLSRNKKYCIKLYHTSTDICLEWQGSNNQIQTSYLK